MHTAPLPIKESDSSTAVPRPPETAPAEKAPSRQSWVGVLDALRGAAALYVVCNHASVLLFPTYKEAVGLGAPLLVRLTAASFSLFGFGHQAVILFFVLSGFCIHYRQAQQIGAASGSGAEFQFSAKSYLVRRLRRIVPPFYFALLLTALLDLAARVINPSFAPHLTGERLADQILVQNNGLHTLLGNLAFLQSLKFPTFGNDTALWSLAFEFYLYLLYPLLLIYRVRAGAYRSVAVVAVASAVAIVALHAVPSAWVLWIFAYWFCWTLGTFAAEMYVGNVPAKRMVLNPALLFVLALMWLALVKVRTIPVPVVDSFGAAVCMLFIIRLLDRSARPLTVPFQRSLAAVGRFSYSLYLNHLPVLCLICYGWFVFANHKPTNPLVALIAVCAAVAWGWCTFQAVERHTLNRS